MECRSSLTVDISPSYDAEISLCPYLVNVSSSISTVWEAATYDPTTYEMEQELVGVGGETCVHTADIYAPDFEGVYRAFGADEPVWKDGRIAFNEIPEDELDFTDGWNITPAGTGSAAVVTSGGFSDPNGGTDASRIQLDLNGGTTSGDLSRCIHGLAINDTKILSIWLKSATGSTYHVQISGNTAAAVDVTDEWQRFSWTTFSPSAFWTIGVQLQGNIVGVSDSADLYAYYPQSEPSLGVSDQTPPSENIVGTKAFANENGNSVTDKVVTEATGTLLDPLPMLVYQSAATNLCLNSNAMDNAVWLKTSLITTPNASVGLTGETTADRIVEVAETNAHAMYQLFTLSAGVNTFVCYAKLHSGSRYLQLRPTGLGLGIAYASFDLSDGSVFMSGGSELVATEITDVGNGIYKLMMEMNNASEPTGMYVTISNSGAEQPSYIGDGTSGFDICNVEAHAKTIPEVRGLGPIFTTTTAVTTDETIITHAAANHDNAEGTYSGVIDYAGDDADVLSLGGAAFLYTEDAPVSGKQLTLSDGTNETSLPIEAGDGQAFEAHYNAADAQMQLKLDAATSDAETYDGTLGTGDITVGETGRDFERSDTSGIV